MPTTTPTTPDTSPNLVQKPWYRRPDQDLYPHTSCGKRKWRHTRILGRFSPTSIVETDESVLAFNPKKVERKGEAKKYLSREEELRCERYWETEEEARKRTPLTPPTSPFFPFATKHDYEWARGFFNNFHPDDGERVMKMWIDGFLWEGLDEYQICSFQTAEELWALLEAAGGVKGFKWNPPLDGDGEKLPRLSEERLAGRCW